MSDDTTKKPTAWRVLHSGQVIGDLDYRQHREDPQYTDDMFEACEWESDEPEEEAVKEGPVFPLDPDNYLKSQLITLSAELELSDEGTKNDLVGRINELSKDDVLDALATLD